MSERQQKHRLNAMRVRLAKRIRTNRVIDEGHKATITNLVWWAVVLRHRVRAGGKIKLRDVAESIAGEVDKLEAEGFFKRDQRVI